MPETKVMKRTKDSQKNPENGSALVIAILVMLLMMGFVALAISRTTTETIISANDDAEAKAYAASEASLESTTRDFVDIFERKLSPDDSDIAAIQNQKVPGFDNFTFSQKVQKIRDATPVILTGGNYSGLYALRDSWQIDSMATEKTSDVKVRINRRFFSDRIPIYQFGMFYEDDLELNRPPLFTFGGRVHTNNNLFITADARSGIYFNSKITAVGEIINDIWKPGTGLIDKIDNQGKVFIKDVSGNPQELKTGEASVKCENVGVGILTPQILATCEKNAEWNTQKIKFQGNLDNNVARLNLPLTKLGTDLIELVRRGKSIGDMQNEAGKIVPVTVETKDNELISKERFANKTGIRISLSDSQKKLPGCANVETGANCGVRLDDKLGTNSIGYQPLTMTDGYKATALNATRFAMTGREMWIKIEMVNANTSALQTNDITQDILSLGVTEAAPVGTDLQISGYRDVTFNGDWTDTRSIIKLQRFSIPGGSIPLSGSTSYTSNYTLDGAPQNLVVRYSNVLTQPVSGCSLCTSVNSFSLPSPDASAVSSSSQEDAAHLKWANIKNSGLVYAIVPFPIEMFDSREGLPNDDQVQANTNFGADKIPSSGVMSMVDIDIANLRRFLSGSFDGKFPENTPYAAAQKKPLRSTDVPNSAGWVVYVSDRRGDYDFDGAYDMEDIFPDGILQTNEDLNNNKTLDRDFGREAPTYTTAVARGQAATADHLYYRRGVRLINASVLPGNYDQTTPANTKGFTFVSENGVYVKGNYNATGAGISKDTSVTSAENYSPQNSATHIPASIAADAVIILSNNWKDSASFIHPFSSADRVASDTVIRFAMLAGDSVTGDKSYYSPSQFGQLNGGVHNFKRFLEKWTDKRLNYAGSLINLFNSQNNNGFQKCCTTVYSPPIRDWTFDNSFLNINRLPPGTPFIYSISFTGFQRIND
jgi:hypothetical protein